MTTLSQFFKKYATAALLLCMLLAPLQSSAALLAQDIKVLRYQAELITEAINNSESITQAKKGELMVVVDKINDLIALYALQVAANPNAESLRRVNIENVIVDANAKDFTAQAQVVWGPEVVGGTSHERSTTSYSYNFLTNLQESQKVARVRQLANLTFKQMSVELGFSPSRLKVTSTISIKRFDDEQDAIDNYTQPEVGAGLERLFGHFSVINDVEILAGKGGFQFQLNTDQDETITLSVIPKYLYVGDSSNSNPDAFVYKITYATYDTVRITAINENADRDSLEKQLSYVLPGIGKQFNVTDQVLIEELLDFMLDHTAYYKTNSPISLPGYSQCHAQDIQDAVYDIFYYYIKNYQVTVDPDFIKVHPPIVLESQYFGDDTYIPSCVGVNNSFFSSLNLN